MIFLMPTRSHHPTLMHSTISKPHSCGGALAMSALAGCAKIRGVVGEMKKERVEKIYIYMERERRVCMCVRVFGLAMHLIVNSIVLSLLFSRMDGEGHSRSNVNTIAFLPTFSWMRLQPTMLALKACTALSARRPCAALLT